MGCTSCGRSLVMNAINKPAVKEVKLLKRHDTSISPVNGFRYVHPKTGFEFNDKYESINDLMAHITRYCRQNNLDLIKEEIVEDWLCKQAGMEFFCGGVIKDLSRTFGQYKSGLKAFFKEAFGGEPVSESEATARAKLCSMCPHNVRVTDLKRSQLITNAIMLKSKAGRRTPYDNRIFVCDVCTCPLAAKVHTSQDIVYESLSEGERKVLSKPIQSTVNNEVFYCWQIKPVN